jgi:hypothetical protein
MFQVSLPDHTAEKLQRIAASRGMDTTQLLVQLVEEYLADQFVPQSGPEERERVEQRSKIEREQQLYEAQHTDLLAGYQGQYIAMHEGKVVDQDVDRIALSRRIRQHYGRTAVLITQVREEPRLIINLRSPRRHRDQE